MVVVKAVKQSGFWVCKFSVAETNELVDCALVGKGRTEIIYNFWLPRMHEHGDVKPHRHE
jgi:hypothetical protein